MDQMKSRGHDNIPAILLKAIGHIVSETLAHFSHFSIQHGLYPRHLKIGVITSIYKSGNRSVMNNYQPIAVALCINTVFEKLLKSRPRDFLEQTKHLSQNDLEIRNKAKHLGRPH